MLWNVSARAYWRGSRPLASRYILQRLLSTTVPDSCKAAYLRLLLPSWSIKSPVVVVVLLLQVFKELQQAKLLAGRQGINVFYVRRLLTCYIGATHLYHTLLPRRASRFKRICIFGPYFPSFNGVLGQNENNVSIKCQNLQLNLAIPHSKHHFDKFAWNHMCINASDCPT